MPFGPYEDFDACVRANQDKRDPEAYCAAIKQEIEGKLVRLAGVEIFSAGSQTDSSGFTNTFTARDLDLIIERFEAGTPEYVPVKMGHTSDDFNEMVAESLDVPVETLRGENGGQDGVISLGRVVGLRRVQNKLVADFDVPAEMKSLVDRHMLRDVSVEMLGESGNWTLTAVAWLGAEMPAVKDLNGLAAAAELRQRTEGPVLAFKREAALGRDEGDKHMSWLETLRSKFSEKSDEEFADMVASKFQDDDEDDDDDNEFQDDEDTVTVAPIGPAVAAAIRAMAGCDINCSDEELLEGLRSILGMPSASPEEMVPVMKARLAQKPVEFKDTAEFKTMSGQIASLERDKRLAHYRREVAGLLVQGKDEDLAEKLVSIEEKSGEGIADEMLGSWRRESEANKQYTKASGRAPVIEDGPDHEYETTIATYMSENKVSRQKAMAQLALDPATSGEFNKWRRETNSGVTEA